MLLQVSLYFLLLHSILQGIFSNKGSNLSLIMFLALAGGFFTASATKEAPGL